MFFSSFFISLKRVGEEKEQRLTVLEECKSSLQQEALKLRTNMRELEKSRLQARRELQELRRQVRAKEIKGFSCVVHAFTLS